MSIDITDKNSSGIAIDQETDQFSILFDNVRQIDIMIGELEDIKQRYLKDKQTEYNNKRQLTLNFEQ